MASFFSRYCELISSAEQLDYCRQAQSLSELFDCIKKLWNCHALSDDELFREISYLNQTPITITNIKLVGNWLPYRYQAKRGLINWLLPVGHATESFFDEYISCCRQQLLNQIIQPCTSLAVAQQQANHLSNIQPAGFIFHLSRCGSTLISGCLSELESTCVFSESPLLTELLLDNQLTVEEQRKFLRMFINLQSAVFASRPQIIIKWNAWDIFRWDLIREMYPDVPVIFLVRDPVEVLASHSRSAGRHMAGDIGLVSMNPVFSVAFNESSETLLNGQSRVLGALLVEMNRLNKQEGVLCVDYKNLDMVGINEICNHFGLLSNPERISQRLKFHSKSPQAVFSNDTQAKQTAFSAEDKARIQQFLLPLYSQFLDNKFQKERVLYEK